MENSEGAVKNYFEAMGLLFVKPLRGFEFIIEKSEKVPQILVLGFYGFFNSVCPIIINESNGAATILKLVFKGLFGAAISWVGIWFISQLTNVLNTIMGGKNESDDIFTVFSFSFLPVVIVYPIFTVLMLFSGSFHFLGIVAGFLIVSSYIWTICLVFIGNRYASGMNWFKSLAAILIPLLIIIGLNILIYKVAYPQ
jgi:hypothetical protein